MRARAERLLVTGRRNVDALRAFGRIGCAGLLGFGAATAAPAGPETLRLDLGGGREAKLVLARSEFGDPLLDPGTRASVRALIEETCPLCVRVAATADRWIWLPAAIRWRDEQAIWVDPWIEIEVADLGSVPAQEIWIYRTPLTGEGDQVWSVQPPTFVPIGWHANDEHRGASAVSLLVAFPRRVEIDEIVSFRFELR